MKCCVYFLMLVVLGLSGCQGAGSDGWAGMDRNPYYYMTANDMGLDEDSNNEGDDEEDNVMLRGRYWE